MKKYGYTMITAFLIGLFGFSSCIGPVDRSKMTMHDLGLWRDTPGWELVNAVKRGNVKKVRRLIHDGIPVDTREPKFGITVLFGAIWEENMEMVQCLLELGADPNARIHSYSTSSSTPFIAACRNAHSMNPVSKDIVIELLKYGANPNAAVEEFTGLGLACRYTDLEFVKTLVEKYNMDVNAEVLREKYCSIYIDTTPLMSAVMFEQFEIAQYFLEKGADPEKANMYENSSDEEPYTFWKAIEHSDKNPRWKDSKHYEEREKRYQKFRSYLRERFNR